VVAALTDINCRVAAGTGLVLAGRSGSGKTTLLNCIGTLEQPDAGTITFNGVSIGDLNASQRSAFRREHIGFVFQSGNLIPWLTVRENLLMPLEMNGVSRQKSLERVSELLAMFGMAGYDTALPAELSGGEAQRVAFARAIAHTPSLVLADEPTASLDSVNGSTLIREMFSLCQSQGTTLVLATHDTDLIAMAERVLWLKDGQMVTEG
jgi:putative ABC transport system ATP-binding protein